MTSKSLDSSIEYYCPVNEENRVTVTEEQIYSVKEMRWNLIYSKEEISLFGLLLYLTTMKNGKKGHV